jgi:hypothetical protein
MTSTRFGGFQASDRLKMANRVGGLVAGVGDGARLRRAFGLLALVLGGAACGARSSLFEGESTPAPPAPACPSAPVGAFSQSFGGDGSQVAVDLLVDRAGYPVLAGAFSGKLDFHRGQVMEAPPPEPAVPTLYGDLLPPWELNGSMFLAKIAPEGCNRYALDFGPIAYGFQSFVTADLDDDLIFAAHYDGTIDVGGGPITEAVVARLGPSGEHRWSKELRTSPVEGLNRMTMSRPAVDAAGNVFITALFTGSLSFDGVILGQSAEKLFDAVVIKLDANGALAWSRILKISSLEMDASALSVAAWPSSGQVAISGVYHHQGDNGDVDLGGGPESFASNQPSFLTSFGAAGNHLWDQYLSPDFVWPGDSLVDEGGRLKIANAMPGDDLQLTVRGPGGEIIANAAEPVNTTFTSRMSIDAAGEILLGGMHFFTEPTSGQATTADAVLAAKVDPAGDVLWSRSFRGAPGESSQYGAVSAFGPTGSPWVAGTFAGGLDFGQGLLTSQGRGTIFLAQLAP